MPTRVEPAQKPQLSFLPHKPLFPQNSPQIDREFSMTPGDTAFFYLLRWLNFFLPGDVTQGENSSNQSIGRSAWRGKFQITECLGWSAQEGLMTPVMVVTDLRAHMRTHPTTRIGMSTHRRLWLAPSYTGRYQDTSPVFCRAGRADHETDRTYR